MKTPQPATKNDPIGSSIRYTEEDRKIIDSIKKKTGIKANAEIVRMGLRALAEKYGVKF